MTSEQVRERRQWAEETAVKVGSLLMASFRSGLDSSEKTAGIVTELDTRAEDLIVRELRQAFPADGLLGEEGTDVASSSGYRWIVDPLDGTTNYVSGIPHFGVSLACLYDSQTVLGVVRSPAATETFVAVAGEGAVGPDGPMRASAKSVLGKAVFLLNKCYLPASVLWASTSDLLADIRAFRYLGCISLDIAYVAAGRVDGLILLPSQPWDIAAGLALLAESGAGYSDLCGDPVPVGEASGVVACAPELLDRVLALVHFEHSV